MDRERALVRLCRRLLSGCAWLVPFRHRSERRREWEAELWVLAGRGAGARRIAAFVWGVCVDALAERREEEGTMGRWLDDVRHALRRIARDPAFAAVTVIILALGVGANTALFAALDAALVKQPPYPEVERMVMVDLLLASNADSPLDTMSWSYPKFEVLRQEMRSVEPLIGYAPMSVTLTGAGDPTRLGAEYVSPGYFELLGVRPVAGRAFGPQDTPPDPGTVAIVSHALWRTRMGGDESAAGRTLLLDGHVFEVVGVAPEGFRGLTGGADLWVPMAAATTLRGARRLEAAWAHWLQVIGRLRAGTSLQDAALEAEALGATLTARYPDPSGGGVHGASVVGFLDARVNPVARIAVTVVWASGIALLLIACGNVAGLFLARASGRRSDVAVRAALGAGRGRLVREHLLESMILSVVGGGLGVGLAVLGSDLVPAAIAYALETSGSRSLQYLDPGSMTVDGSVLAWGAVLAVLAGLTFGLLPARTATRVDLTGDLRSGASAVIGRPGSGWARGGLVAGQLALTLVLLAGAGLMIESFRGLGHVSTGFTHRDVLSISFDRGPGSAEVENAAFEATLLDRVGALPGVGGVAVTTCAPLTGRCEITGIRQVDDGPLIDFGDMEGILTYTVSDDYFSTIGAEPVAGRAFGAEDASGLPVVVINQAAAEAFFEGPSALGRRIAITHSLTSEQPATVVGVVPDVRYGDLEEPVMPALYLSARQAPRGYGTLLVRAPEPTSLVPAIRGIASELSPDLPLTNITTLGDLAALATARTRVVLWLLAAFAASGLLLSALGLYALVSYSVARRTREVGVRMALGATRPSILGTVASGPSLLVAAGALAGTGSALLATRYLGALLFEVRPTDPLVLAAAASVLVMVGVLATVLPARRAMRVDPSEALRSE